MGHIPAKLLEDKKCCCKVSEIQSNYSKLSHLPLALSLTKLSEEFQVMGFHFKSPILDLFHGFIVVLPPGSVTFFLFFGGGGSSFTP